MFCMGLHLTCPFSSLIFFAMTAKLVIADVISYCGDYDYIYCSATFCCQGSCTSLYQDYATCIVTTRNYGCTQPVSCPGPGVCQDETHNLVHCKYLNQAACTGDGPSYCLKDDSKSFMLDISCSSGSIGLLAFAVSSCYFRKWDTLQ